MSHTNKTIRLSAKIFLLGIGLTLVACGGGGESSTGVVYTGSTSAADVDDTNIQTYSSAIMDGSQDSQDNLNNIPFSVVTDDNTSSQNKQYALLNTLVKQVKNDFENNNLESPNLVSAATQPPVVGNCPGKEGSFTITGTSSSTGANLSITYSSYCVTTSGIEVTLSGSLSAVVVISDSVISSMDITIPRLSITVTDTNTSTTYANEFSGTISATFAPAGALDSMSVSVNFVENGKVYKISGLSYTQTGAGISISGKIYHPDYGFVTYTTTDPFALYNDQLCDGTLEVTGANSNFTITVNTDCSTYTYSGTNKDSVAFSGSFTSL